MIKTHFYLAIAGVSFVIGFFVVFFQNGTTPSAVKEESSAAVETTEKVPVNVISIERGRIERRFTSFSHLQPIREAILRSQNNVLVKELYVKWGAYVKKGEILAEFESEAGRLKSELESIDLSARAMDYKINKSLAEKEFISGQEFAQKERDFHAQRIRMKLSDIESSKKLVSPIDGIVSEVNLKKGDFIENSTEKYIRVIDPSQFKLTLFVPQSVALHLKQGIPVTLDRDGLSGRGTLSAVAPAVDPKSGSVLIEILSEEVPKEWLAGMYVGVSLPIEAQTDVLLVPVAAIFFEDSKPNVFRIIASDETVEKIPVETGIMDGQFAEIKLGLEDFDTIVVKGQTLLKNGAAVDIKDP